MEQNYLTRILRSAEVMFTKQHDGERDASILAYYYFYDKDRNMLGSKSDDPKKKKGCLVPFNDVLTIDREVSLAISNTLLMYTNDKGIPYDKQQQDLWWNQILKELRSNPKQALTGIVRWKDGETLHAINIDITEQKKVITKLLNKLQELSVMGYISTDTYNQAKNNFFD